MLVSQTRSKWIWHVLKSDDDKKRHGHDCSYSDMISVTGSWLGRDLRHDYSIFNMTATTVAWFKQLQKDRSDSTSMSTKIQTQWRRVKHNQGDSKIITETWQCLQLWKWLGHWLGHDCHDSDVTPDLERIATSQRITTVAQTWMWPQWLKHQHCNHSTVTAVTQTSSWWLRRDRSDSGITVATHIYWLGNDCDEWGITPASDLTAVTQMTQTLTWSFEHNCSD